MSELSASAVAVEQDIDVILIHGVGNAVLGDLGRTVVSTLQRASLTGQRDVHLFECNWNQLVEPSARDGGILNSAWQDLSLTLAYASAVGDGTRKVGWAAGPLRIIASVALMCAELGLAAALAVLLIIIPLMFVTFLMAHSETLAYGSTKTALKFVQECMIEVGLAIVVLVLAGLIRSICVWFSWPFFVELRRAFIFILRPFFVGGTAFFLVPWHKLAGSEFKEFLFTLTAVMTFGTILFLIIDLLDNPIGFSWSEHFLAALFTYAGIIILGIAGFAIAFLTVSIVGPILKILLDIFRYIANPSYRAKIQTYLNGAIKPLSIERKGQGPCS
jgi:hypothetical protein